MLPPTARERWAIDYVIYVTYNNTVCRRRTFYVNSEQAAKRARALLAYTLAGRGRYYGVISVHYAVAEME